MGYQVSFFIERVTAGPRISRNGHNRLIDGPLWGLNKYSRKIARGRTAEDRTAPFKGASRISDKLNSLGLQITFDEAETRAAIRKTLRIAIYRPAQLFSGKAVKCVLSGIETNPKMNYGDSKMRLWDWSGLPSDVIIFETILRDPAVAAWTPDTIADFISRVEVWEPIKSIIVSNFLDYDCEPKKARTILARLADKGVEIFRIPLIFYRKRNETIKPDPTS